MSTVLGHSLLQALHDRHKSSTSCTPSDASAASGSPAPSSWPLIASRSALARPRTVSFSLRVAMYDGHMVPEPTLRQAPTPLHCSTAAWKPPWSS